MRAALDARMLVGYTGIERYLRGLLQHLPAVAPDLDLSALVQPAHRVALRDLAPDVRPVVVAAPPFSLGEQVAVARALRRSRFDVVHFAAPNAPVAPVGPRVTTFHDLTLLDHPESAGTGAVVRAKLRVFRAVMGRSAAASQLVLTPSTATADRVLARFPRAAGRVRVVHLGAPEPQRPANGSRQPFLLHVGNAYPYKNLDRLVAAFAIVRRSHPEQRLVLAGPVGAQREQLRASAHRHGIGDAVDLPGRVSDDELAQLYATAALFVLPSLSEGFGLPALEAMAHGAPVLAAQATSLPEVCGDAAAYFDPLDVDALAAQAVRLLADPPERERLSRAGLARARAFSWVATAEQTAQAYRDAAATPAP